MNLVKAQQTKFCFTIDREAVYLDRISLSNRTNREAVFSDRVSLSNRTDRESVFSGPFQLVKPYGS